MNIEKVRLNDLLYADYNPRKELKAGDTEYEKIKSSLLEFGYVAPVIVNQYGCEEGKYKIVGGHQRSTVLRDLGFTEIECVVIDVDENQEKALNIALNKITGEWDDEKLSKLLDELRLEEYNIELTGFDWDEAEALFDEYASEDSVEDDNPDDDFEIELPEEPISQLGDIWILGKHRLLCGDSTKEDEVMKLMGDDRADMVFTDPPWNVNYGAVDMNNAMGYKPRTILNDFMGTEDFKQFMYEAFNCMNLASKDGAMTYVVMSAQEWGNMMLTLAQNDYHWSSTVIWAKDRHVMSRKDYHTRYEPIWYGWKEGEARLHPLKDRKQNDVWDIPRPKKSELHPTCKPVDLVIKALKNSSSINDIVLDLFGGSGTTLVAAEETGRVCRMNELDPKYVDVIVKRYIDKVGSDVDVKLIRGQNEIKYNKQKMQKM